MRLTYEDVFYGTPVTAKYTPTVTPAATTGLQGVKQEGKPEFKPGNPNVPIDETVAPTFEDGTTEKKVPGEGTYTIDKDGKVTFTPEPQFVGTAKGVTVKRVDKNGTSVTANYTPTVKPVEPTGEPAKTINKKGETQTGTTKFTPVDPNVPIDEKVPATFEDGSKEKVVPGEGKYTVAPDGTVTFVPEKDFIGAASGVLVVRVDTEGNLAYGAYIPTVLPTPSVPETPYAPAPTKPATDKVLTTYLDENGELIIPDENGQVVNPEEQGSNPSKDLSGYELVRTEKDANGNVRHVYRKVAKQTPASPEKVARQELPQTGTGSEFAIFGAAATAILAGLGMVAPTKKDEE